MRSPYAGEKSLRGAAEQSYSFTTGVAWGLRLREGTELYLNPEAAQGRPPSRLQGLIRGV
jgi:hypothetical protein